MSSKNVIKKERAQSESITRLSASVLAEIAALIAETSYGERLWLRNPGVLDPENEAARQMSLYYVTDQGIDMDSLLREIVGKLPVWPSIFGKETKPLFSGSGEVTGEGRLMLNLSFEIKSLPLMIMVRQSPRLAEPVAKSHRMIFDEERVYDILELSPEDEAAECMVKILEQLELISDMRPYGELMELLTEESLRGHQVSERFLSGCREKNLELDEKRLELWESYSEYIYMKRKWDKYKKRQKNMSYPWETTHNLLSKFIKPIYETIIREEVFFGDWMPELGRFLD